jgi:hypothetical protein
MVTSAALLDFRRPRRIRRAAWLGLLALLLQTLIPFSQAIPAPWPTRSGALLLCKSFGAAQTVPLSLGTESDKRNPPGSHPFQCPVCQLHVTCGVGLPAPAGTAALLLPARRSPIPAPPTADGASATHRHTPAQPRAPPLFG